MSAEDAPTVTDTTARTEPFDTEVLPANAREQLRAEGFTGDLDILPGGTLHCHVCAEDHDASEVSIERIHRYEGVTNPGDEESVLGLACPCGCRGIATTAMGVYGDSAVGDAFRAMRDERER